MTEEEELMDRFLSLDHLLPGDVVISSAPTWPSRQVRLATFFRFSHVAVVVDPLLWFEAIPHGTTYTPINPELRLVGGRLRCGWQIPKGANVRVLRHPDIAAIAPTDHEYSNALCAFQVRLAETTVNHYLSEYPKKDKFLKLLKLRLGDLAIIQWGARKLAAREIKVFEGHFCSSLVACCLREAGVDLLPNVSHEAISPRSIYKKSGMRNVAEIFEAANNTLPAPIENVAARLRTVQSFQAGNVLSSRALVSGLRLHFVIASKTANLEAFVQSLKTFQGKPSSDVHNALAQQLQAIDEEAWKDFSKAQESARTIIRVLPHYHTFRSSLAGAGKCTEKCARGEGEKAWVGCSSGNCALSNQYFSEALQNLQEPIKRLHEELEADVLKSLQKSDTIS